MGVRARYPPAGGSVHSTAPGSPVEPAAQTRGTVLHAAGLAHAQRFVARIWRAPDRLGVGSAGLRLPVTAPCHAVQSLCKAGQWQLSPERDLERRRRLADTA